jgi:hypothetical protein
MPWQLRVRQHGWLLMLVLLIMLLLLLLVLLLLLLLLVLLQTALVRTFERMKTLNTRCGFQQLASIHGTSGFTYDGIRAGSRG